MPGRSKLYVLVHDGGRFLATSGSSGFVIPNHTMWPVMKPRPRIHWARRLLRHVTYDLFEFEDLYEVCLKGIFGIPKNSIFAVFEVVPEFLDQVVSTCRTVRLWHQHHGPYECPWAWKAAPITVPKEQLDLVTHFALEALRSGAVGRSGPSEEVSEAEAGAAQANQTDGPHHVQAEVDTHGSTSPSMA